MNWEVRTMPSKTSFFNRALFRKNLTRFWPLWGMASFVGALFPLAMLMQLIRGHEGSIDPLEFTRVYYSILTVAVPVVSLLYAILCAMMVWSYLYNARSVGLLHTLPIRREGLFWTNFLSGMAMMLIPYAVTGALCVLISLAYGGFEPVGLAVTVLGVLGESFFYFASATFAAFVTGNLFALPAVYFLLHFLSVLLDWLVSTLAQGFIFGLNRSYSGVAEWLCPTVTLERGLRPNGTYEEVLRRAANGTGYYRNTLTAIDLEGFWIVGVYVLVGAALLAAAWLLYRRRHSESAGDVVAVGWLRPVFRCGVTALAALLGGILLYELFWQNVQYSPYYDAVPMTVCMIVAGVIGYYASAMLLRKSLQVFRGSWKGLLLLAACCVAVCCVLRFDLLGVSGRVPAVGEVERVELYVADNNYTFYPGEEDALLEEVRRVHAAVAADWAYIRELEQQDWNGDLRQDENLSFGNALHLTYVLKDGRTVDRFYNLPIARDRLAQAGTYDQLLDQLLNSQEMRTKRLRVGDSRYEISNGSLYVERRQQGYDLGSREAAAILAAVERDAAAGAWGSYDWFAGRDSDGSYAVSLELNFSCYLEERTYNDWIRVVLRPGMTETLNCLRELGLVTEGDLITYSQLYAEDTAASAGTLVEEPASLEETEVPA